ncbi:hypothetical protein SAMN06265173_11757 [Thalassovita litoralis]|jgi:hypothetical protein|uniref:Uncharacterized protein n=1 Tax=Thalassovita litoralis TaxID=1010611 RepID=A0A521ELG1_9RHOB|nr:hypothetical protein [Thalassovita litoralis]SMO84732.1 hypothetical protein SAMN06265173_11757 [Thalassovita litoralis]
MKIILHAGAHATDEDRVVKCLLKNSGLLSGRNAAVPGPSRYRSLIRDTLAAMDEGPLAPDARDLILDAIIESDHPARLILSNEHFFGVPKIAVTGGLFYPGAETKLQKLCDLFDGDSVELYLGLRNPATFLPALHALCPKMSFQDFLGGSDPLQLHWSELLMRIRTALPDLPITVWCNEDTPLIWAEILRDLMGLPAGEKITGGFDLLTEIMTQDGMQRFRTYLKSHPVMSDEQKRRVISAFLDKFARPEAIEEEIDVPGWTGETIDYLSAAYEQDVARIATLPGLRLLQP